MLVDVKAAQDHYLAQSLTRTLNGQSSDFCAALRPHPGLADYPGLADRRVGMGVGACMGIGEGEGVGMAWGVGVGVGVDVCLFSSRTAMRTAWVLARARGDAHGCSPGGAPAHPGM